MRRWVKIPNPDPSDKILPVGLGEVPQTVPRSVITPPPSPVTVPPKTAEAVVTDAKVGASSVGGVGGGSVEKELSAEYEVPAELVA